MQLCLRPEFCLRNDEPVPRRIEDGNAERRDAIAGLGEGRTRQCGGQVVMFSPG